MIRRKSVALFIETSNNYSRGLLSGIVAYLNHHQSWSVVLPEKERGADPPDWFPDWDGDGIIARIETPQIAESLYGTNLPIVDLSTAGYLKDVPRVHTDDDTIAEMALEHLVERGFKCLAYCGNPDLAWSIQRRDYFVMHAKRKGLNVATLMLPDMQADVPCPIMQPKLNEWLSQLPRPVGILACNDLRGQQLLDVCRNQEIVVPEEVAVLGVDNDELLCNLCWPTLSSVIPDTHCTGYKAAALLDQMMRGETVSNRAILVRPLGIQVRQSTDTMAIDDNQVATALTIIRQRAFDGIKVGDIVRDMTVSRRVLESRFKKILGRTPHEEIVRLRINRVKKLLLETQLSLSSIAKRAGFQHVEYMSTAFKRQVGLSPSTFRRNRVTNV